MCLQTFCRHLPTGVLCDLLCDLANVPIVADPPGIMHSLSPAGIQLPWPLTLHFRSPPAEAHISWLNQQPVKVQFLNSFKVRGPPLRPTQTKTGHTPQVEPA